MSDSIDYRTSKLTEHGEFLYRKQRFKPLTGCLQRWLPVGDKDVLDLGCGYGPVSELLSELGARVCSVDIDEHSLTNARVYIQGDDISLVRNSAEDLAFKDKSFDCVVSFGVLEHVRDPERSLAECHRVLKDGAILLIVFNPYYSVAGHHLYDYTLLPVQFLPKTLVRWYILKKRFNP
ncbi:MAG: class I SAM-dependent methyltransferase, partial [Chloroflexi bacterium]|nr:class I SAM-dependent methyltransferase [Chloroflexota bacterium]